MPHYGGKTRADAFRVCRAARQKLPACNIHDRERSDMREAGSRQKRHSPSLQENLGVVGEMIMGFSCARGVFEADLVLLR